MESLLTSDLTNLNEIFLGHQIHSLRLSDQRSFFDGLSQKPARTYHPGDMVLFQKERYWVEEIEGNSLLLKNQTKVLYKKIQDEDLEVVPGHYLLDLLE